MSDDIVSDFWTHAADVTAGMLSAEGVSPRPMAHHARQEDNALWFITPNETDISDAATQGKAARFILACSHGKIYAVIDGHLTLETSKEMLKDVWSPMDAAWFEDGKDDDAVRLVRFAPKSAEVWVHDGSARELYEMARAMVSDKQPDVGGHGKITF